MDVRLIRVDDRLIHGQVVFGWTQTLGIEQILVADDAAAADPTQRDLLLLAVPAGVVGDVLSVADSAKVLLASSSKVPTMVLVRGPRELMGLKRAGVAMPEVNVGNVHTGPGRRRLTKEVHATDEEIEVWRALAADGVRLEALWMPGQTRTDIGRLVAQASA